MAELACGLHGFISPAYTVCICGYCNSCYVYTNSTQMIVLSWVTRSIEGTKRLHDGAVIADAAEFISLWRNFRVRIDTIFVVVSSGRRSFPVASLEFLLPSARRPAITKLRACFVAFFEDAGRP